MIYIQAIDNDDKLKKGQMSQKEFLNRIPEIGHATGLPTTSSHYNFGFVVKDDEISWLTQCELDRSRLRTVSFSPRGKRQDALHLRLEVGFIERFERVAVFNLRTLETRVVGVDYLEDGKYYIDRGEVLSTIIDFALQGGFSRTEFNSKGLSTSLISNYGLKLDGKIQVDVNPRYFLRFTDSSGKGCTLEELLSYN